MNLSTSLISLLLVTAACAACSSTVSGPPAPGPAATSTGTTPPTTPPPSGSIAGSYKGTYEGDDRGPVTMTLTGSMIDVVATVGGKGYPGSGMVAANGGVNLGIGAGAGVTVTFSGSFTNGKDGAGTWSSSAGTEGTWKVTK